ncbi:PREDICTED: protocadherin-10 [Chaetura pelagica]|uniref:protocadherin-10 n=1 Tax=Chaetura pelagica TaxID=8897 RepID=UPI0005238AAE|nr:PREDICTED: protocadherin-10 [Chaetura pelagica]
MIVLFLFALLWMVEGALCQLHYTVQEEQEHGTFVGNIAEDLGLDITKLSARRFQTAPNSRSPYLELNLETGVLYVNEKIDREQICKQSPSCLLHLEVFLENPLELFRVEIEVLDINDNPPSFPEPDLTVEISESATPGTRFPLESAFDPDVGTNSLRTYEITPNSYFSLDVQTQGDGNRFAELVLDKPLDREQQAVPRDVLTAVDGGQPPQRTGTALLTIRALDSNDNVPAYDQPVYTVSLPENSPPGTLVLQLNATDPDEGQNGEVIYSFSSHISARARELFGIAPRTGRLEVSGELDYEESSVYQVYVQAKDLGPNAVPAHCKVLVRVLDANDNAPEISFSTVKEAVSEAAAPGTVVALFSVSDRDSEENGQVQCELLQGDAPFRLKSSFKNYYTIVTEGPLDREQPGGDAYTLTVVARDRGQPPLSTSKSIQVRVSDVNDNAPRFSQPVYQVYVSENNVPGAYIYAVSATDRDQGANAQLAYSILESQNQGMSVFTYVSINSENGFLYTKHQRAELSYLVDRPRRVNSSAFQEADIVSSKDSGHGDSEQGDSDHDATNRGQSSGMDLFSNCTEECKALGHSDRCWMPSFVPSDGRQAADYRSNLHVPGMDSVPDTEVFETPEAQPGAERSFSTFGKEKALHNTLERKELDGLLSNTRAPYKPPYLSKYYSKSCMKVFPLRE